ncbi:ferritin-like domain-containing protein [Rhodoferax sp. PAMC 29310]|uniref:ferritin-like domain-containing protein n=1 Tax=Rhodoferax sp. PAMC 29310 TaxID=2822760 RepID=UPI001F0B4B62|nr:ferritin-like domain-containing protein [Rhodoferax sp. PAMC 29310]
MTLPHINTPNTTPLPSMRMLARQLIRIESPDQKADEVRGIESKDLSIDASEKIDCVQGIPGRPNRPALVHPGQLKPRAVGTIEGRATLIHALAHIEANAVNLALDVIWRFEGMPERFYLDWLQVAREEALHFQLLRDHLRTLGYSYGDFPAHDGLWEMAEKTKGSLIARLALVPRTLEARGLDVTPTIRTKLISVSDRAGAAILDIILRDEIGHVAIGNHWYRHLCAQNQLDHVSTYATLARTYGAKPLKGPFNLDARRAAGFDETELSVLGG